MDVDMSAKEGPGTPRQPLTCRSSSRLLCAALSYTLLGERSICKNWKTRWQSQKNLASELSWVYRHSLFLNSAFFVRATPAISDQVLSSYPSKTNKQFYYEMRH